MNGQTVILYGKRARDDAHTMIDRAPVNAKVTVAAPKRTIPQSDKMWAMLGDVSRFKPEGRMWVPETWKCAFMHSAGHQVRFCEGLDDSGPFPIGFRSSQLSKEQMAALITVIEEYGTRHGVRWSNEAER